MKNTILPGDTVILSASNGLGRGKFYVLEADGHELYIQGPNGVTHTARAKGARVVPEEPAGRFTSSRYGDW